MRRIFLASMLVFISGAAWAAGPKQTLLPGYDASTEAPTEAAQPTAHEPAPAASGEAGLQVREPTRIETDQKTGAVKIIINNREVARFDAYGLHVRDDVVYGGFMTDTGDSPVAYEKRLAAEPKH